MPTISCVQNTRTVNAHSARASALLGTVRQQFDNVDFSSQEHPLTHSCVSPTTTTTYITANHNVAALPPPSADTIHPAPTPASTTMANTTTSRTLPPPLPPLPDGTTADVPATASNTTSTATSGDVDSAQACPQCDRTFTSHIDLAGHLRIHCTRSGEPVP
nr:unnamed protein product [Spirometra erinaceieuropaei]